MAPNTSLPAHRFVITRLLKAGFTNNFACIRAGEDGILELELQCKLSKAFHTFEPVRLIPDHRYLFTSREQIIASGLPSYQFVIPTMVQADIEGDAILPFLRLPGAPGQRPWMYYTQLNDSFVRITVKGKQDVTLGLEEHRYTNWNGVFFLRRSTGIRPTDYGVVPIKKATWNAFCAEHGMSKFQTKLLFNKAVKAVSHGHLPEAERLYSALYDLQQRDNEGARVTRELVEAVIDFAKSQQLVMSEGSRVRRQERLEEQVHDAMDELQDLINGCGMATPLQSAAIEQWLYARMSHPHVLRVYNNPPAFYSWEGPDAMAPSESRGTARIEIEMEGHDTFQRGVIYDLALPALTGEGCDFLHNNLEELADNFFDYEDAPKSSSHYSARTTKAEPECSSRSYFKDVPSKPAPAMAPAQVAHTIPASEFAPLPKAPSAAKVPALLR